MDDLDKLVMKMFTSAIIYNKTQEALIAMTERNLNSELAAVKLFTLQFEVTMLEEITKFKTMLVQIIDKKIEEKINHLISQGLMQ